MSFSIFTELLKSLSAPLKESSRLTLLLTELIADACGRLWEDAQDQIKEDFPRFTDKESLPLWAEERGIRPIVGESTDLFRKRAEKAFLFLTGLGTRNSMERIIGQVTLKPFRIRELYSENWILGASSELLGETTRLSDGRSAFVFVVEFDGLTLGEKTYLETLIQIYKPAHTLFRIEADILDDWLLGSPGERLGESTYLEP